MNKRLDQVLIEEYGYHSRNAAQTAIQEGYIKVNNRIIKKKSYLVQEQDIIEIIPQQFDFASRAAFKLFHALEYFNIDLYDKVILDIGASTGGFTDVCLYNKAKYIYAIDAGKDQLIERLKTHPKVCGRESINARYLTKDMFDTNIDFVCMDVSFISIRLIIDNLVNILDKPMQGVFLIKPQFEVGKAWIGKNGIVKDKKIHIKLLQDYIQYFNDLNLNVQGLCKSSVVGKDGNQEYLIYVNSEKKSRSIDCKNIVKE